MNNRTITILLLLTALIVFVLVTGTISAKAEVPSQVWARTFAHGTYGESWFNYVLPTSDGGQIAVGAIKLNEYQDVTQPLYVVKTKADGSGDWGFSFGTTGTYGSASNYEGWSVVQRDDGGYIVVGNEYNRGNPVKSNIYILFISATGNWEKELSFGGTIHDHGIAFPARCIGYSIARTKDGGYIIAGATNKEGNIAFGFNPQGDISSQMYLLKINAAGSILWERGFGGVPGNDEAYSVQQTNDGGYVLAGWTSCHSNWNNPAHKNDLSKKYYVVKTGSSGAVQWQCAGGDWNYFNDCTANSVRQTSDNGYVLGCSGYIGPGKHSYGMLVTLNTAGWQATPWHYESSGYTFSDIDGHERTYAVPAKDGGYLLTGHSNSNSGAYLLKTKANAYEKIWGISLDSSSRTGVNYPRCIAQTADGSYVIAGYKKYSEDSINAFLIKVGVTGDNTPPVIISTSPVNGASSIPVNTLVTATFSEDMNPSTISAGFTLKDSGGVKVAGTISYNNKILTFKPTNPLAKGKKYTATVSGVKDLAGNAMAKPYTWTFTTATADTTKPTVLSTVPANGAKSVKTSTTVTVKFSEDMSPSTISAGFTLKDSGGVKVAGTISYSNKILTFKPKNLLAKNKKYTATVSGVKDLAGNAMAKPYAWSFTTTT